MLRRSVPCLLVAAALAVVATDAGAQATADGPLATPPPSLGLGLEAPPAPGLLATPAGAFGASLLVPGAGQAALGLRRWLLYGALELALWTVRIDAVRDRRRFSRAYRDLAWEEARLPGSHPRQEGSWGYYETMRDYLRSGAFDTEASVPGIQPEEDPGTYNGTVWQLARALYLPGGTGGPGSPGYEAALTYYEGRAAGPAFLWSWAGREDALDRFRQLIEQADDEARLATRAFGLVLANHLVSAMDALISARLRDDGRVRLESHTETTGPLRWSIGLRISLQD